MKKAAASYIIRKNGINLWTGEYTSPEAALAAYINELGAEALDYAAVDPDWTDGLEVEADATA